MSKSYTISLSGRTITCNRCGLSSHNKNDISNKYCNYCHIYHNDIVTPEQRFTSKPSPIPSISEQPYGVWDNHYMTWGITIWLDEVTSVWIASILNEQYRKNIKFREKI